MEVSEEKILEMIAYEAFIRRASEINMPFMLKGSYNTRQYFPNPMDRLPTDLDWVYMEKLNNVEDATNKFDNWVIAITELEKSDGVKFNSFRKNQFWRMMDYAMADDFPTVNTDLICWVDEVEVHFSLDISFNLDIEYPPIPLTYKPLRGESFIVCNTVPLSLQISWKVHQTLVRPRFKDLFDLILLVQHPTFNNDVREQAVQALVNECSADNVDLNRLRLFLSNNLEKLFANDSIDKHWNYWRHKIKDTDLTIYIDMYDYDNAENITNASKLPENLSVFLNEFGLTMQNAGFGIDLMEHLPEATRQQRKTFEQPIIQTEIKKEKQNTVFYYLKNLFK